VADLRLTADEASVDSFVSDRVLLFSFGECNESLFERNNDFGSSGESELIGGLENGPELSIDDESDE
jgi:hypothetical protein